MQMDRKEMERRVNETRICCQCKQEKNVLLEFCKKRSAWCLDCHNAHTRKAVEKSFGKKYQNQKDFNRYDFRK